MDQPAASALECPDCGSVEWRRSGTIIVGDASPGDSTDPAQVFAGATSDTLAWTCTCGRELAADDPRSLALDSMAPLRERWVRDRR